MTQKGLVVLTPDQFAEAVVQTAKRRRVECLREVQETVQEVVNNNGGGTDGQRSGEDN